MALVAVVCRMANPQENAGDLSPFFAGVADDGSSQSPDGIAEPLDPNDFRFGKYGPSSLANEVYLIARNDEIQKCKVMYRIKQITNEVTYWYVMYTLSGEIFLEEDISEYARIQSPQLDELFSIIATSRKRVANLIIRSIIDRITALDHLYHARAVVREAVEEYGHT
tara:strand:+ start:309 stop:809 length:501 start_codon:yes stop_codon:yes gene_type:complete